MKNRSWRYGALLPAIALLAAVVPSPAKAASFAEPATVFYGKVTGTGSPQPFMVTDGELTWTILKADGSEIALRTPLFPHHGGEYSYRLDVPHEAFAVGLEGSSESIPLGIAEQTHAHVSISVNGVPATILGPSGSTFSVAQLQRAATHRLDLAVDLMDLDSDGDGMPDRWEDLHGLDKQDPTDAGGDLDGDGLTNLAEFLGGFDPGADSREPKLVTREFMAYPGATTGVVLEVADSDSDPAVIVLTLDAGPGDGTLYRRNAQLDAAQPDLPVAVGEQFSLEDVRRGLITFVPNEPQAGNYDRIELTVEDEDPAHARDSAVVTILHYRPNSALLGVFTDGEALDIAENSRLVTGLSDLTAQRFRSHVLGTQSAYLLRDPGAALSGVRASTPTSGMSRDDYEQIYRPNYGSARSHVLMDSLGDDVLEGGMERDLLTAGRGSDHLRGGPGRDDFVFLAFDERIDTVADFQVADGDRIVLCLPPGGPSPYINDYLRVSPAGGDLLLDVDLDGSGGPYDDAAITLAGGPPNTGLRQLWEGGFLLAAGMGLQPYLDIEATEPLAYEAGSTGLFTITRGGDPSFELTVVVSVTGSAMNGVDFQQVTSPLTFPAGATTLEVPIVPFTDSVTEGLGEVVQLTLLAGDGYDLGETASAQVEIRDPIPVMTLAAVGPLASQQDGIQGMLLLTRSAAIDEQTLVFLDIGGSATNGLDYQFVSSFVLLDPGETLRLIPIVPQPGANLQGGAEIVQMRIADQPGYLLGDPAAADVTIVAQTTSYAQWVSENFPGAPSDLGAFGATDPGGYGVPVFRRYAFGTDPLQPSPFDLGTARMVDGHLTIEVGVRPGALDLIYVPEVSVDGGAWQRGAAWAAEVPADFGTGDPWRRLFRAAKSIEELEKQLMRVSAE